MGLALLSSANLPLATTSLLQLRYCGEFSLEKLVAEPHLVWTWGLNFPLPSSTFITISTIYRSAYVFRYISFHFSLAFLSPLLFGFKPILEPSFQYTGFSRPWPSPCNRLLRISTLPSRNAWQVVDAGLRIWDLERWVVPGGPIASFVHILVWFHSRWMGDYSSCLFGCFCFWIDRIL